MLDVLKLKGKIAENELNITKLAEKLGINRDTFFGGIYGKFKSY